MFWVMVHFLRARLRAGVCFFLMLSVGVPGWEAQAQPVVLPLPGALMQPSPGLELPLLTGLKIHPDNPFLFDFILDPGRSVQSSGSARYDAGQLKKASATLIQYFLAAIAVPQQDLWVNLSPYEHDRIIPKAFGRTALGRDLLAQDDVLKQLTASLMYPEGDVGRRFWSRIYQQAAAQWGTTSIRVNAFNKVWIVPDKAVVYENAANGTAYVSDTRLRVMLEEDYVATRKSTEGRDDPAMAVARDCMREVILPALEREVNEGAHFAPLRQIYHSLVLAFWYKRKVQSGILARTYAGRNKTTGVEFQEGENAVGIYRHYLAAFKKGAYNYIKDEKDPMTGQVVPRKYFSGGLTLNDRAMERAVRVLPMRPDFKGPANDRAMNVAVRVGAVRYPSLSAGEIFILSNRIYEYPSRGPFNPGAVLAPFFVRLPSNAGGELRGYLGGELFTFQAREIGRKVSAAVEASGIMRKVWSLPGAEWDRLREALEKAEANSRGQRDGRTPRQLHFSSIRSDIAPEEKMREGDLIVRESREGVLFLPIKGLPTMKRGLHLGLPDPELYEESTVSFELDGGPTFIFYRKVDHARLDWNHYVWTIHDDNFERLNRALEEQVRREAALAEAKHNPTGLGAFSDGDFLIIDNQMIMFGDNSPPEHINVPKLPRPDRISATTYLYNIGGKVFTLTKKYRYTDQDIAGRRAKFNPIYWSGPIEQKDDFLAALRNPPAPAGAEEEAAAGAGGEQLKALSENEFMIILNEAIIFGNGSPGVIMRVPELPKPSQVEGMVYAYTIGGEQVTLIKRLRHNDPKDANGRVRKANPVFWAGPMGQWAAFRTAIEKHQEAAKQGQVEADAAMTGTSPTGGIDLTADKGMTVARGNGGQGIPFHVDPDQLAAWEQSPGITVDILHVAPVNVRRFFGQPALSASFR